jgi:DNA-binding MarR family transcriptional regulator
MPEQSMTEPYYTLEGLQANNSLGYLIKRCGVLATQIAERDFQSQPISFTQWMVLMRLSDNANLTPSELSKQIGHDMGALTRIVDDLHDKQLVRRERCELDRRAVRITITPAGRRVAMTTKSVVLELANKQVEIYSKAETDLLISLLQRMLVHMEKVAGEPAEEPALGGRRTPVRR